MDRDGPGRHQEAVLHGPLQLVGIGGLVVIQLEQLVGIAVHIAPGCGGQTQQQRVEVIEDGPVLLVHRAVTPLAPLPAGASLPPWGAPPRRTRPQGSTFGLTRVVSWA
jgi:hypothetical protein